MYTGGATSGREQNEHKTLTKLNSSNIVACEGGGINQPVSQSVELRIYFHNFPDAATFVSDFSFGQQKSILSGLNIRP